ncbi:hypothetical protein NY2A_b538L [Paramecium bursaria Chlorella virus NY2A]|uniref:Uncharacterized protein b538L n=1 Tax=Paramecium bursaria Chlorella virus NY2A TaxID=46021 RepID=A7IX63_PBCVN|nr:hypothetical protein NY2A_b538L [Paramecium bursaria Chlorella virus NY2A]YP_001498563.1 hypothetical protein AR158_c482L [Paramecium bursaria Chlorella virus AR158]ABT14937.1 hypothetical protein NY2A_b538L [Paramecium bursaria Chlorella virus NY2A]ABU44027.1 hypothetical protein AR158_c482L [Paramecium bursaria Chlorella virus AR158]
MIERELRVDPFDGFFQKPEQFDLFIYMCVPDQSRIKNENFLQIVERLEQSRVHHIVIIHHNISYFA